MRIARAADRLVLLAALGVLAATAAALAAKTWWIFDLFAHFKLQYAALLLVLTGALLALGRRRFAALTALCLLPNVWPLAAYWAAVAPASPAVAEVDRIKLMSVNVEWRNRSAARLLDMIRDEAPDAVLVVEYTAEWRERLGPIFADYPHRVELDGGRAFGIALLSRAPLKNVQPFKLESTPAIDATLVTARGELLLIGVHLLPPTRAAWAAERARQLDALAERAQRIDGALAIAGDFNLSAYSPHFSGLLRTAGLRDSRAMPGITWPSFLPLLGIPIDHCIVSDEVGVAAFRRLPAFGSDHYPIVVELTVGSEA